MALEIPLRLYDYILYYECAAKDWKGAGSSVKSKIASLSPGSLRNYINWSVSGTTVKGDSGGNTKCGITHKTWSNLYSSLNKKYGVNTGKNVNNMNQYGWESLIKYMWTYTSYAASCANLACGIVLFQAQWAGWSGYNSCIKTLKQEANKPTSGSYSGYSGIAKLTHCFSDPMEAYKIIHDAHTEYLYNLSLPGKKNSQFRVGWMRRELLPFQGDGLYVEPGASVFCKKSNSSLNISQWYSLAQANYNKSGYVKILSWDTPTTFDTSNAGYEDCPVVDDESTNRSSWGTPIDGGIKSYGLNTNHNTKGIVLGLHLNQK